MASRMHGSSFVIANDPTGSPRSPPTLFDVDYNLGAKLTIENLITMTELNLAKNEKTEIAVENQFKNTGEKTNVKLTCTEPQVPTEQMNTSKSNEQNGGVKRPCPTEKLDCLDTKRTDRERTDWVEVMPSERKRISQQDLEAILSLQLQRDTEVSNDYIRNFLDDLITDNREENEDVAMYISHCGGVQVKSRLEHYFQKNPKLNAQEIHAFAMDLQLEKEVVNGSATVDRKKNE